MSEKRCLKLTRKILECKAKRLHPKVVRRLENKLSGAMIHHVRPQLANECQSLFQSARCTLVEILNRVTEFAGDKASTTKADSFLQVYSNITVKPNVDKEVVKEITQEDVFNELRNLAFVFTKVNDKLQFNVMLLGGLLNSLYKDGYGILGIDKEQLNLTPYFNKCGILADKLMTTVIANAGKK